MRCNFPRAAGRFLFCIGLISGYGCANQEAAPSSYLDESQKCISLDDRLPLTLGLIEAGELSQLKKALSEEMDTSSQRVLIRLVSGILEIFPPDRFSELAAVGQSKLMPRVLQLLHDLLISAENLDPEVQRAFDEGIHRFGQSCSLVPVLRSVHGAMTHADEILEVLTAFLGGSGDILNASAVDPQAWFDLYVGFLDMGAALPGSGEDLKQLMSLLASFTGMEAIDDLGVIFDDPILMADLAQSSYCLQSIEIAYGYGVLWGVAHISAGNATEPAKGLELSDDEAGAKASSSEGVDPVVLSAIQDLLEGLFSSLELVESLRMALDWLLYPERVAPIRPDIARLLASGAIEELWGVAAKIGEEACVLPVSSEPSPARAGVP